MRAVRPASCLAAVLALGAALAPRAGAQEALARRLLLDALRNSVHGTVSIGSVSGSLLSAIELNNVVLADSAGRPVIRVARVSARYTLTDLLRGRYRLDHVVVVRPILNLEQDAAGVWNVARLFGSGGGGPRTGSAPLVELTDVRVAEGTLVLRQRSGDTVLERTASNLEAVLRRLRASHPDSAGIAAVISRLTCRLTQPSLDVRGLSGEAVIVGDSLLLNLAHVRLPGTSTALRGRVRWGGGHTSADLTFDATTLAFADLRGLVTELPREGGGRAAGSLRLLAGGAVELTVREGQVRSGASALAGSGRLDIGSDRTFALHDLDVTASPLELSLLRTWTDSVPIQGRLRGRVRADGPMDELMARGSLTWDDPLAPGATNIVTGNGKLSLGGAERVTFRGFSVTRSALDFRSIRRFLPSAVLTGRLEAAGRLDGPYRHGSFNGAAVHTEGDTLRSLVRGSAAWDLRDSVRLDVEMAADSLSLDLLRHAFPSLPLSGRVAGSVRVHGWLPALGTVVALAGPGGGLDATGVIAVHDSATRVDASGAITDVNLNAHRSELPHSDLGGRWAASLVVPRDTAHPVTGSVRAALTRSVVAGVEMQSADALIQLREDRIEVDSLGVLAPGASFSVAGVVARSERGTSDLTVTARADTLGVFEPLAREMLRLNGDTTSVGFDGGLTGSAHLSGSAGRWAADGRLAFTHAAYGAAHGENVRLTGTVERGAGAMRVHGRVVADSVVLGSLAYGPVGIDADGRLDSLALAGSAGFATSSAAQGRVVVWGDSAVRQIRIDALRFDLPTRSLVLVRPSTLRFTPEAVRVDSLELRSPTTGGRLFADGTLPRTGVGSFTLFADSVPLEDLFTLAGRDTTGVGGRLDLVWMVAGPAATPTMQLGVALTDGRFADYRAPLAQVLANYNQQRLTLKGGIWRDSVRIVSLSGDAPIDLALQRVERRRLAGPVALQARSDSVDLRLFNALTDLVTNLSGTVSLQVAAGGTWDSISLSGFLDVRNGALTVPAIGGRYTGMDVRLDFADSVVRVSRALLNAGGALEVGGQMLLRPGSRPLLDLTLHADRFAAFDIKSFAGLTGSGDLTLRGPVLGATLSGQLVVDAGYLRFADLVQKRIVSLDDPEFRAVVDTNLARASGLEPPAHAIFLDSLVVTNLTATMGSDVWLRSNEANIQLDGAFTMWRWTEGHLPRFRFEGNMHAARGTYRLELGPTNSPFTRDFRVTDGTVRFYGTPDFNPDMDITAEHQVRTQSHDQFTVFARIGGTLLYPRLTLESDRRPVLSETEIVAYLLFGQPLSALANTPGNSALNQIGLPGQVAAGIAGSLGQGLISEFGLPLDYLTLIPGSGASAFANARIGAGAQIGRRTFLTLTAGLCEVYTSQLVGASIEYQLSRPWSVAAAFEPVVQECGTSYQLRGLSKTYQLSFDLKWRQGGR